MIVCANAALSGGRIPFNNKAARLDGRINHCRRLRLLKACGCRRLAANGQPGSTAMSSLWSQQLAADAEGTLYLSWVDALDDHPYLAISRDRGQHWNAPRCLAPDGVDMASISGIAVLGVGKVAIACYGSRDAGWSFDGFVTVTRDALAATPCRQSVQTSPEQPLQPNRLSEPCEYVGVAFAPDGSLCVSFARDTRVVDRSSEQRQADGNFHYNGTRFLGVVLHLI